MFVIYIYIRHVARMYEQFDYESVVARTNEVEDESTDESSEEEVDDN